MELGVFDSPESIIAKRNHEQEMRKMEQVNDDTIPILLNAGADPNKIINKLESPREKLRLFKKFEDAGADIDPDDIAKELYEVHGSSEFYRNIQQLLDIGADPDLIASYISDNDLQLCLRKILAAGVSNPDELVSRLSPGSVANNLKSLLDAGAEINVNELVSRLSPGSVANNLKSLLDAGAEINVNELVSRLSPDSVANNLKSLLDAGAEINVLKVIYDMDSPHVTHMVDTLLEVANGNWDILHAITSKLDRLYVLHNLEKLRKAGATYINVNVNFLIAYELSPIDIVNNIETLIDAGADPNEIAKRLRRAEDKDKNYLISLCVVRLRGHENSTEVNGSTSQDELNDTVDGNSQDSHHSKMSQEDATKIIEEYCSLDEVEDVYDIFSKPTFFGIARDYSELVEALLAIGEDPDKIVDKMKSHQLERRARTKGFTMSNLLA